MAVGADNEMDYAQRAKRVQRTIAAVLVFSLAVFIAISAFAVLSEGSEKFIATLLSVNPLYYAMAFLCVFLSDLVGFPKWHMFIKKLGVKVKMKDNLPIYLSMFSMDITPGRLGRAVVSYTLNKLTGVRFVKTLPAVIADIFTDYLGFVVITLISALLVRRYLPLSITISMILLLPFVFIYTRAPYKFFKRKFGSYRRLRGIFKHGDMFYRSHSLLDLGSYTYAMIFTIPAMTLNGISLYFVMLSVGISLPLSYIPTILFIFTSAMLIGMITGIPGTLGVTDAALLGYLVIFFGNKGVSVGVASAITILFRIASIWFAVGMSMIFLLYTTKYWKNAKSS